MRRATLSMFAQIVQLLPQSLFLSPFKSIKQTKVLKASAQETSSLQ